MPYYATQASSEVELNCGVMLLFLRITQPCTEQGAKVFCDLFGTYLSDQMRTVNRQCKWIDVSGSTYLSSRSRHIVYYLFIQWFPASGTLDRQYLEGIEIFRKKPRCSHAWEKKCPVTLKDLEGFTRKKDLVKRNEKRKVINFWSSSSSS